MEMVVTDRFRHVVTLLVKDRGIAWNIAIDSLVNEVVEQPCVRKDVAYIVFNFLLLEVGDQLFHIELV